MHVKIRKENILWEEVGLCGKKDSDSYDTKCVLICF